jgi:hypothetical protein
MMIVMRHKLSISVSSLALVILLFNFLTGCSREKEVSHSSTEQKTETIPAPSIQKFASDSTRVKISGLTYDVNNLPDGIKYQGKVVAGARWEDKNGSNILVITETKQTLSGEKKEKELFGYHFMDKEMGPELLWKINDFVKDCEFDITLEFVTGSLTITDLNKDGVAESTFLYKMSCRSDVSPNVLKLLMHEGNKKYAMRGTTKVEIKGEKPYGGETNIDPSFNLAPEIFLSYAKEQWTKFQTEKY